MFCAIFHFSVNPSLNVKKRLLNKEIYSKLQAIRMNGPTDKV